MFSYLNLQTLWNVGLHFKICLLIAGYRDTNIYSHTFTVAHTHTASVMIDVLVFGFVDKWREKVTFLGTPCTSHDIRAFSDTTDRCTVTRLNSLSCSLEAKLTHIQVKSSENREVQLSSAVNVNEPKAVGNWTCMTRAANKKCPLGS